MNYYYDFIIIVIILNYITYKVYPNKTKNKLKKE